MKRFLVSALLIGTALTLLGCTGTEPPAATQAVTPEPYSAASTPAEIQQQMRSLPEDDIWWTVNGYDMAWNNRNLHMIFPTVNVYRNGPVSHLQSKPMQEIANFPVEVTGERMTFDEFLASDHSTAMGVVILHKGQVVFERYPRMQPYEKPVYWSVAKVFPATLIRILEERGEVDVSQSIERYIPELSDSALAGTSVRDILDMATGLDCGDEYESRDTCYYRYSMAIGDGFRTADAPDNPYDFVASLDVRRVAEPGTRYSYSGLNTFVLAWLVEKLTDLPFQEAFTREIWWQIGAQADASYIAPRYGIPVTHGGFMANMRDVARFGLLFTPSFGVVNEDRIISIEHIEFLRSAGRPSLFANAGMPPPEDSGVRYNIYQWDAVLTNGALYKGGWAGQGLYIHPDRDVVAVFTGYFKDDQNSEVALEPMLFNLLNTVFSEDP